MTTLESNLIGAGYNVPLVSLANIASITPSGDVAFASPKSLSLYNDGQSEPLLTMQLFSEGFASITWEFGFMTYKQYYYLRSTYCAGGLSGEVTIASYIAGVSVVRMNAILTLKTPAEMQALFWFKPVPVLFTTLSTAS